MLERNNESLATSNRTLFQDNTLFHYKIEQTNKLIDMVAHKANELQVKVFKIGNNIHKYCCYPIFDPCFDKFSEKIQK